MAKHKNCSNCETPLDSIQSKGGQCLPCVNLKQRMYRQKTSNLSTKVYEKTLKGYLVRTYRNMTSRVRGILKKKAHLYEGKSILTKDEFYEWSLSSKEFHDLMARYEDSDYDLKLAPSIDRIDSSLGYTLGNIQWITFSENSRKGAHNKHEKEKYNGK